VDALDRKQRLLEAVKTSNLELLESLLKEGGNINSIFPNGKTLLIMAIEQQNQEVVDFLIGAGANLNQRDFYDHTPLMYAYLQENSSIASSLLKAGADTNIKNKQGHTALSYAQHKKNPGLVNLAVQAGAEMPVYNREQDHTPRRLKEFFSMDEFTELKNPPAFAENEGVYYFMASTFVPLLLGFLPRWSVLHWLVLAWVVWRLLFWFPSIGSIFPLGWEILQMYRGKSPANEQNRVRAARQINTPNDLSFVSLLMDLGARELASIHRTHSDRGSLPVKRAIFFSRLLSVLLAGSIVTLTLVFLAYDSARAPGADGMNEIGGSLFCGLYLMYFVVLPLSTFFMFGLEEKLRVRRLRLVQTDRDRIAGALSNMLNAEDVPEKELPTDFGLYLRAFMTTDKLPIKGFDFETMLAYSIAPTLPLVALGKPGEHLGAGRIRTTDEYWRDEILRLMEAARLILIIPSYRPGTLWEISTLREKGFFPKTIFIMPPELNFHGDKYSKDWQQTVDAAQEKGVEFPFHVPSGLFFRLSPDGELEDYAPCLPEEFMKETDVELPWQAQAGGSIEAAVESSGMTAVTAGMHHAHEVHHAHAENPFQHIDDFLAADHAADGGHAGDAYGDDGSDAGYHAW